MRIAAQLSRGDLKIFIEGATWKKATLPLNKERIKIDRVVYMIESGPVFHDAVSTPEPDTHPSLMFCREDLTLADFKKKLKKAGYGEPYEVSLSSSLFTLKKRYTDAYYILFKDYRENEAFTGWLSNMPALEGGFLLQRVKDAGRYYSRDFSEFSESGSIEEFMDHQFEIWQEEAVKEFEEALVKGKAHCPGCNI